MPIPRAYRNDPQAPWNEPEAPECPDCMETIVDQDDHTEWCEFQGTQAQIFEYYAEEPAVYEEY